MAGTVSTPAKAEEARAQGCEHVALYGDGADAGDWAKELVAAVGGQKFDVVFDSVGKDTFSQSLQVLRPRGMCEGALDNMTFTTHVINSCLCVFSRAFVCPCVYGQACASCMGRAVEQ